ncbi:MAG TPA: ATP phosphoribosyltransferase regulatory subunit, partial [Croceibacterium sp.]|nr:ATP phosphoribosyltransferase regulatory subunit [Croceibacterium sp.]
DARIVGGILAGTSVGAAAQSEIHAALAVKDGAALRELTRGLPEPARRGLLALPGLYGAADVIDAAHRELPAHPSVSAALDDLASLVEHARLAHPDVRVGVDLADIGGYAYYSGACFAAYAPGSSEALARGGRYDQVGAVFGRNRPAVGFSLDLKQLAALAPAQGAGAAIRAPWGEDADLRRAVRRLRERGETVVCVLPGHEHEAQEFECDRELVEIANQWTVQTL